MGWFEEDAFEKCVGENYLVKQVRRICNRGDKLSKWEFELLDLIVSGMLRFQVAYLDCFLENVKYN